MPRTHRLKVGDKIAIIDAADRHLVSGYKWHLGGTGKRYVATNLKGGSKTAYLHRIIMAPGPGEIVDHANGDPLDNRRKNLRIVTASENGLNRTHTSNPTGYKGVCYFPDKRKYQGRLNHNGGVYRGPYRDNPLDAAKDYDRLARGIGGNLATVNFPKAGERGVIPLEGLAPHE